MRWSEFEQSTRAYQSVQKAIAAEHRRADEQRMQEYKAEKQEQLQAELARVKGVLEKFHAGDILETIRDEVWKEGQVEEFEGNWDRTNPRRGVRLLSDKYPVVELKGQGRKLAAVLGEERTSLEVYVTPDYQHRPTEVHANGWNVFDVKDASKLSIEDAVRQQGLERGLWTTAVMAHHRVTPHSFLGVHPDKEGSIDMFNDAILRQVDQIQQNESFPTQIRAWGERIVSKLPSSLRSTGIVTPQELRDWAHNIQGSSIIYRATDKVASRFGLGLKV